MRIKGNLSDRFDFVFSTSSLQLPGLVGNPGNAQYDALMFIQCLLKEWQLAQEIPMTNGIINNHSVSEEGFAVL